METTQSRFHISVGTILWPYNFNLFRSVKRAKQRRSTLWNRLKLRHQMACKAWTPCPHSFWCGRNRHQKMVPRYCMYVCCNPTCYLRLLFLSRNILCLRFVLEAFAKGKTWLSNSIWVEQGTGSADVECIVVRFASLEYRWFCSSLQITASLSSSQLMSCCLSVEE